jgi:hypothetical protein
MENEPFENACNKQVEALKCSQVKVRVRVDGDSNSLVVTVLRTGLDTRKILGHSQSYSDSPEEELTLDPPISTQDDSPLERQTYKYSLWHYLSPMQQLQQEESSPRMSSYDIDVSRLEHEIQKLQDDLNDVNCIRDIDDMALELKEKKSALRNLRWKRRLGIS